MRTPLFLLALALLLPLAACASEPEVEEVEPDVVAVEPMTEDPAPADVTAAGTVDAVQAAGGLLELAPATAVQNIDGWIAQLSGNEAFAPVVEDLEALKMELQAETIDGGAVGGLLVELGMATTEAAGEDTSLQALGSALTEAGNALTSM